MATVRISQLTAITAPTDDDVLIINDADTNTRKITFANLTQNLVNTTAAAQTKSGALTVSGTLTAGSNFVVDTNTFFVDATNNRVGVRTITPNSEFDIDGTIHIRNSNTLEFGDANDSNYVSLGAPSVIATNFALTLPASLPSANNLLWSDGSGNLGYTTGLTYDSGTQSISLGQAYLTNQGAVRFYEQSANGTDYVGFTAPANLGATTGYTLPGTYPASSGFVLSSTTGGVLSWVSNSAGAAGVTGNVQFSDGSNLTADSSFTYVVGSQTLSVPNLTVGSDLTCNGNITLGNGSGDNIFVNGSLASNLTPNITGIRNLGTSILRYASLHVEDLYSYGNVELGNAPGDTVSINGSVDTSILPDADNTRSLGSSILQYAGIFGVNGTFTGQLVVGGDVDLGNASGDTVSVNGSIDTNLIPTGLRNLGSSGNKWNQLHVDQLNTYGTTTLGDTAGDSIIINGVLQSSIVPSGFFNLGSSGSRWQNVYATTVDATAVTTSGGATVGTTLTVASFKTSAYSDSSVASAGTADFQLENVTTHQGYKATIFARDLTTDDTEVFEYLIATDGTVVNGQAGTGVESTGGTNLVTPSVSIVTVGPDDFVRLTLTNTAVSTNDVAVRAQVTAIPTI